MKRAWKPSPVIQIVQKNSEKYCRCLYLSIDQVWGVNELWFKRHIQNYALSHVLIFIMTSQIWSLMGWLKVKNLNISKKQNITFPWNKKILNLSLRWRILRSYHFVAEITFKYACAVSYLILRSNYFTCSAMSNLNSADFTTPNSHKRF